MSVSSSLLYLITSCELPKDAWDTLKRHFERNTLSNKLFLKKQYFRKEMCEGTPINAHLKEMKMLADKLASIGAPVSEEDQVVTLLGSLPASFATTVTALEARSDGMTMDYVQESLIHHEQKLKSKEITPGTGNTALLGQRRKGPPVCWSCNEVGHVQRYCPKKKEKLSHGAALVEEEVLDDSRGEGAFVTTTFTGGAWLVDSRASSHMTPNKEYFASYRMFDKPEKVHLGDGRVVEAVGVGNIRLKMVFKVSRCKPATMYKQSAKKLELVHSDICGPIQVDSIGGSRYFATFIF